MVSSLKGADHVIAQVGDETASGFITRHRELALDDGLNETDIELLKYYVDFPAIVDKIIEKVGSHEDRLFALNELTAYVSKPLKEEQAYQLIEKWYPELFEVTKKTGQSVLFGDLDKPKPDGLRNYEEIFEHGTDPFKTNNWIKFVFNFTRRPSDFYEGSTDTRDLAAAFDSIQFLDRNSSVLATIEFRLGDEKFLGKGWYPIEYLEEGFYPPVEEMTGKNFSWAGKNATVILMIWIY